MDLKEMVKDAESTRNDFGHVTVQRDDFLALVSIAEKAVAVDAAWCALTDESRAKYTGSDFAEMLKHDEPFVAAYHAALNDIHDALASAGLVKA